MLNKLKILETLFLPEWNTTAHICEGGLIYVQLIAGRYYTKYQYVQDEIFLQFNSSFHEPRLKLFDELQEYYNLNHKK